ncbi:MAG: RNA methyltransferase [Simkaniaceae bacterium]|nr:RNA methyltransferase [Simkaniaceae bacterium]
MKKQKHVSKDFQHYYGSPSCRAILMNRIKDVEKVYLIQELVHPFSQFLQKLAELKKGYKIVKEDDLRKLTDSTHHEGICVVAQKKLPIPFAKARKDLEKACCIAYLDEVMNPHNLGAMIRTAAHFGINYLILPDAMPLPPSGYRIAREGAEYVTLISSQFPKKDLLDLKKMGFKLFATSPRQGRSLHKVIPPKKSLLILGSETKGVSPELFDMADELITIEGSGHVESLNVSNAFCLLAYQFTTHQAET